MGQEAARPPCCIWLLIRMRHVAVWTAILFIWGSCCWCRPTSLSKQVALGVQYPKLVSVRAEWVEGEARHKGGWKLTTKPSRILM